MELLMKKNISRVMALITLAALAACAATKNTSLAEAHNSYNNAIANPQIASMAALELKDADSSLNKADQALLNGESTENVNHLSYLAKQKISIAQETAIRKNAEQTINNANANRNLIQLDARTAEANAAKQQVANIQETADQQALALSAAYAQAEQDRLTIAQQDVLLKDLKAIKTKRGLVVTLGDVLFNTNKDQLKPEGTRSVQKLADFLKKYPQHKVLIEGYTDNRGSNKLNQNLSERRADTVRVALTGMGIGNGRISTEGYGERYPVAKNNTLANRQANRRVEIILSDESGSIAKR
jgi:outer membrane protein OmpA-like peptidoglycan-associated protein